jgi:hypothetical protein
VPRGQRDRSLRPYFRISKPNHTTLYNNNFIKSSPRKNALSYYFSRALWVLLVQECQADRMSFEASPSLFCSQGEKGCTYEAVVIGWPLLNGQHTVQIV